MRQQVNPGDSVFDEGGDRHPPAHRGRVASNALRSHGFDDIDVASCDARIADLERRRDEIR